ncbi:glycosyl hydrolase family 28-related protein [Streptomyces sp. NPDC001118]|uniref:glycosyl hydrolase family 28-related protein n=1 Tax=Streptomyces sp. NPDC001127 TaxID=3154377 RepID=UPI0033285FAB
MARNLFGGTADSVAEDITGARVPNAAGTVWDGPSAGAAQLTDLTDINGAPLTQLQADAHGYVAPFYGPDGYERVWLDFGAGRVALVSVTVGERLDSHLSGIDPHGDRAYADSNFLRRTSIDWVSVKDYGAVGNGTADDSAAVTAAVAAVSSNGGVVYFPAGTYLINSGTGLTLATAATTLRGTGAEASKLVIGSGFTGSSLLSITAYNCQVSDLSISGASSTTTNNPACNAITVTGARRTKVARCTFFNVNGWAVKAVASTSSTGNPDGTQISNLVVRSCAGGIHFLGNTAQGYAVNSFISDVQILQGGVSSGASANLDNIRIEDSWDVLIDNVMTWMSDGTGSCLHVAGNCAATFVMNLDTLGPNGTPNAPSVLIEDGANGSPQNVQITGGVIQQGSVGVKVSGAASQVRINTSRIINNRTHGIQVDGTSSTIYLNDLFFSLNGAGASGTNYDLNWSGSAVGFVSNCRFATPIVATGTAGVQQSINVATTGQNVRVINASFQGTGQNSTNWYTNKPSAVLHLTNGVFEFLTDVNFNFGPGNRVALQPSSSGNYCLATNVGGLDPYDRFRLLGTGATQYGPGTAARDTTWQRMNPAQIGTPDSDIVIGLAGKGLFVKEGTNAKMGTAVLNGTTAVTVSTTAVTANSRIFLSIQTPGGTPASPYVSARTAGTSFQIKSTGASDTSTVAWHIVEPA